MIKVKLDTHIELNYDIVITFKLSMCQLTGNLTCKENMSSSSVSSNPLEGNKISFDLKVRLEL